MSVENTKNDSAGDRGDASKDASVTSSDLSYMSLDPAEAIAVYRKIIAAKMGDVFSVDQESDKIEYLGPDQDGSVQAEIEATEREDQLRRDAALQHPALAEDALSSPLQSVIQSLGIDDVATTDADPALALQLLAEKAKKKKAKKKGQKLKLQIAHQSAGRVRMKIAAAKGDPELLQKIGETFGVIPGIEHVSVNPVTGSIVLHYDTQSRLVNDKLVRSLMAQSHASMPGSEIDELARKIESEAEFLAQRSKIARILVDFIKKLDKQIKVATKNLVDIKIVLAIGVIVLTIFEIGANTATPVWLTLAIFTFNHFVELRHASQEDEFAPILAPVVFKNA
jgi:hypothetical protein